jgi:hypothetical protein
VTDLPIATPALATAETTVVEFADERPEMPRKRPEDSMAPRISPVRRLVLVLGVREDAEDIAQAYEQPFGLGGIRWAGSASLAPHDRAVSPSTS